MELLRAADILVEKIKKDYADDVAVVVIYGSYIYNETHSKSDLDMYFVPKTERGKNLGAACIIDGVGFDFWPITWERLEKIANYDEKTTSIITEGRIYYYGTEEDLERFNQVKSKALDVSDQGKFIRKSQEVFDTTYKSYFKLQKAENISEARIHAMGIIFSLTYALALLNRTTVKRGRGKLKKEIMDMPLVPKDFSSLYEMVFVSNDITEIKKAYGQLISNAQELISNEQSKVMKRYTYVEVFGDYYEEIINLYNKIYYACEIGDVHTALFAAVQLTNEFETAYSYAGMSTNQLPDIVGAFDPQNTERFLELVHEHQAKFVEFLQVNDIRLKEFRDFNQLEEYMKSL